MNSSLDPRSFLLDLYASAVRAASAEQCLPSYLQRHAASASGGRTLVIGAGKAAAAMAQTVEAHWPGELSGLVVTRYGHGVPCKRIEVVEAGHPLPDQAGWQAAQRMLQMVRGLNGHDLVICLLSGGGSALLAVPAEGITLEDKRAIGKALLKSGAAIHEMNCVRKHLSAIKGGRLALACAPARVLTFLISDVAGDDASTIASGPTLPDASSCADALAILDKYRIAVPDHVRRHLESGAGETPKPGDARFEGHAHYMIASARTALEAAARTAQGQGIAAHILSDALEGEAREVGAAQAALAKEVARDRQPFSKPCVLLSGGETTVTVNGSGRGGRNAEFLLAMAIALEGCPSVHALACDTDGIDGSEDNAGAIIGPDTLARAQALGLDAKALLGDNDAFRFFAALDDLVTTGPTRTNVNDFRAVLVL